MKCNGEKRIEWENEGKERTSMRNLMDGTSRRVERLKWKEMHGMKDEPTSCGNTEHQNGELS